jgi:mannose-1-phosphate guanylyltransferase/mannose-6-phosphate isomerase
MVVTLADQTVVNAAAFTKGMQEAVAEAAEGNIVILGATQDMPETVYGYIQTCPSGRDEPQTIHVVQRLVEKPAEVPARAYQNKD